LQVVVVLEVTQDLEQELEDIDHLLLEKALVEEQQLSQSFLLALA
jgi:hypothetical protein